MDSRNLKKVGVFVGLFTLFQAFDFLLGGFGLSRSFQTEANVMGAAFITYLLYSY